MTDRVVLDGREGEGGGQVLRSALALSLATGRPFVLEHVRARRDRPGLLRQHLTGLRLAAEIGDAELDGATPGSRRVAFAPRGFRAGRFHAAVGTAGSTVLVASTVLPALLVGKEAVELEVEGGTHAKGAPCFEFLRDVLLPALEELGARLELTLLAHGFYPAGGGRMRVAVNPTAHPRPYVSLERGRLQATHASALVSQLPRHIAERELEEVRRRLGWKDRDRDVEVIQGGAGPGNAVVLTVRHAHATDVVAAYGALGVSAERVATKACREAQAWLAADVPVGTWLADQLLVPLALAAGGRFRTLPLSLHARTNIDVVHAFLGPVIDVAEDGTAVVVTVKGRYGVG
ncbi:MAG: RNA 3'-terminal phosphate cyclase [Planctomycetota bacterium]